jgi:hypothetical protein
MADMETTTTMSWQTYYSEFLKREYYYHPELKILTWNLPDVIIDSISSQELSSDGEIETRETSERLNFLYRNILCIILRISTLLLNGKLFLWFQVLLFVHSCCNNFCELDFMYFGFDDPPKVEMFVSEKRHGKHNDIPYPMEYFPNIFVNYDKGHIFPYDVNNICRAQHSFEASDFAPKDFSRISKEACLDFESMDISGLVASSSWNNTFSLPIN